MVESQKGGGRETDNDLDGLGGGEVGSGAFNGQSCACDIEGEGINDNRLGTEEDFVGGWVIGGSDDEVYWEAVGDGVERKRRGEGDLAEGWSLLCCSKDS